MALTACGSSDQTARSGNESSGGERVVSAIGTSDGKVLIAYFTAADNSGVDAESSASYSMVDGEAKGRLQAIAEMIQKTAGGDLFSIQTDVVYPADGFTISEKDVPDAEGEVTDWLSGLGY